jgi:hypothetical protein
MNNKGLLFIPDISGFTQFVNQTDIDHSRLIIQELLEKIINANQMGLEVSEVEGDAILFYKFGDPPELKEIYTQVEKMFREFHKQLLSYDHLKYCQCKACVSATNLSLKVITHYGEFTGYNVKQFNKLIGKDVIIAHQLLKNDIEQHEYWLVTKNLVQDKNPDGFSDWMEWKSSIKQTENGEIPFLYTQLTQLKNEITPDLPQNIELEKKIKLFSFAQEYETDIITLFHATGDFNNRHRWFEGVKSVEVLDQHLPRIGMKCKCVMDNEEDVIISSSYSYSDTKIEFAETDEKKMSSISFTLEKISDKKSRLTIDFYLRKNLLLQILFNLLKKNKIKRMFSNSMLNLDKLVKELNFRYSIT